MANFNAPASPTRSRPTGSTRAIRSMTQRQLDAYLQARDTLRRLRAVSALTADVMPRAAPSSSRT